MHISHLSSQQDLYLDNQYLALKPINIETEQEIFQLDDDMRVMVQDKLVNNYPAHKKARVLLEHLFNEENIAVCSESGEEYALINNEVQKIVE